jgi:pilus assembly protein TadC
MTIDTTGGHPAMDYAEHQRTYNGFVRGTVILTALVAFILACMAYFLV